MSWKDRHSRQRSFTLVEVVVALALMGVGLIGIIQLFPRGLQASVRAESNSRAALLAQEIMQALMTDDVDIPIIPGYRGLVPLPGDGVDNDWRILNPEQIPGLDRNGNRRIDINYDGVFVDRYRRSGQVQTLGADGCRDINPLTGQVLGDANGDGDPYYDPENFANIFSRSTADVGADEEYADGRDNDGDGRIDEDCMLATNLYLGNPLTPHPLGPGNGWDDDGDGEVGSPTIQVWVDDDGNPGTPPVSRIVRIKDGEDNNGDGRVDEGIDEEIFDGIDNDGDGRTDEDCRLASFPFTPEPFLPLVQAAPGVDSGRLAHANERFGWQIFVGRVSDGAGNGLDDDGDGRIDEDPLDGINNDLCGCNPSDPSSSCDTRIDEDPSSMPMPGFRKVVIRITWGGDGNDNDNDGRIDEELKDGLDDDFDGRIDEDTYEFFYELTGLIKIKAQE